MKNEEEYELHDRGRNEHLNEIGGLINGDKLGTIETYEDGDYNCELCGNLGNFNDGSIFGIGKDNLENVLCNSCLEKNNEIGGLIEDFIKTKDLHPPKDVIIQHFIEWFTSDDSERHQMIQAMEYYLKEGIDKETE